MPTFATSWRDWCLTSASARITFLPRLISTVSYKLLVLPQLMSEGQAMAMSPLTTEAIVLAIENL